MAYGYWPHNNNLTSRLLLATNNSHTIQTLSPHKHNQSQKYVTGKMLYRVCCY